MSIRELPKRNFDADCATITDGVLRADATKGKRKNLDFAIPVRNRSHAPRNFRNWMNLNSRLVTLAEERILNLGEFHGRSAFFVVIGHVVNSGAHGIAPRQPRIVGLRSSHRS
jgi:hypothetical protein